MVPSPSLSARETEADRSLSLIQLQASWDYMVKPHLRENGGGAKGAVLVRFVLLFCLFGQHDTS